ncbi:Lipopolysaccharide assembly protein A [Pseudidiomarina piscicola]|uniref:Lipopolysaccharide assembly protein A n=1 Tax=Pseudidiomarina piscicola TaxID=2614830 RepID=A0A6S6WTP1_9GAMM|nr:LapA family protein [Pseudidiomarina piscicola]CAB0150068.1 Lipopolysaccharide assembly protein A [Pseudidiomarina piscicola]VZT39510.1 Lipopolysaccharide assembly protein A [Pseudomonas aeruginosa]
MLRFIFIGLPLLLLFLLAVAFGALNKQPIPFDFLLGQITLPVSVLTGMFILLGFLLGLASMLARQVALKSENRKLRKQIVSRESADA